ncbi:MAG: hypothetical protein QOF76_2034 [Solirubrobacteraceae bacterium]|jgi:uncharacterized protein (DUF433 family)|nr:hypothetical protein [Solirubrobacteraceae bacterium]
MVVVVAGAVALGGAVGGVAVGAGGSKSDPEDAVIADAAKQLNVTPKALHDALKSAEDAQLDAEVKAGHLTQKQADAIKAQRTHVLGGPPGFGRPGGFPGGPHVFPGGPPGATGPSGPGGFFPGPPGGFHGGPPMMIGPFGDVVDAVTKLLGVSRTELFRELRSGTSLSDIATAHGKTLDDVKTAVHDAAKTTLDEAVKAGRLTQAQEDEILSHIGDAVDHFGDHPMPVPGPGFSGRDRRWHHP